MKLLFLSNKVPYPANDGGTIASLGMMKTFAQLGHSVTVLTMNTLKHHVALDEIPHELKQAISFHLVEVKAPILPHKLLFNFLFSRKPYNAVRFIDENYRSKLIEILLSEQFDVVQLEGLYVCPYIETIRKYSKALIAYRSHNVEHEIWQRTAHAAKGLKQVYVTNLAARIKKMELDMLNQYDVLVPITERDNQLYTLLGNTKPAVAIPVGIEIPENPIHKEIPQNNLFFIGALDWTPNQEGLLWFLEKCWPEIRRKQPEVELFIAGRNAPKWFIERLKAEQVHYIGEVGNAYTFMHQNGIMIAPLLSGGGMRVKIIEGMLHRKPIVTTTIGCEGIDAEHRNNIMISANEKDFISHTLELINNPILQSRISENSYKFVRENFSNETLVRRLSDFYKNHIR